MTNRSLPNIPVFDVPRLDRGTQSEAVMGTPDKPGCVEEGLAGAIIPPYNAPMSLDITAIDHIQITCSPAQETATVVFYRGTLGLSEIEKPDELKSRGGAWFQLGSQQLHIGVDKTHGDTTKAHICFLVADLVAAQSTLEAAGIEITPEPIDATGLKRFFVRDPAGNRVEMGMR